MHARTLLLLLVSVGAPTSSRLADSRAVASEPALAPVAADAPIPAFVQDVQPLLTKYCAECHRGDKAKAGLAFDAFRDERAAVPLGGKHADPGKQRDGNSEEHAAGRFSYEPIQ
jgi:hypothetical protein